MVPHLLFLRDIEARKNRHDLLPGLEYQSLARCGAARAANRHGVADGRGQQPGVAIAPIGAGIQTALAQDRRAEAGSFSLVDNPYLERSTCPEQHAQCSLYQDRRRQRGNPACDLSRSGQRLPTLIETLHRIHQDTEDQVELVQQISRTPGLLSDITATQMVAAYCVQRADLIGYHRMLTVWRGTQTAPSIKRVIDHWRDVVDEIEENTKAVLQRLTQEVGIGQC